MQNESIIWHKKRQFSPLSSTVYEAYVMQTVYRMKNT